MRTFFPADETARNAFNAMLTSGGACYWMAIITPNDGSTPMVFGTIPTTAMTGYTIMAGRLIDISDIEQSIDPYKDTFAKTPNVSVEVYNADGAVNQAIMAGSTITIRMGYGATMSIATSEVFFTGKIAEIDRNELHKLKFECNGTLQKFDGEVGEISELAVKEDAGKILPIVNGIWEDEYAFCPLLNISTISIDYAYGKNDYTPENGQLWIYNKDSKKGYEALPIGTSEIYLIAAGKISKSITTFNTVKNIPGYTGAATDLIEIQTTEASYNLILADNKYVLTIDNEYMSIVEKYTKTVVTDYGPPIVNRTDYYFLCVRACHGSTLASHPFPKAASVITMGEIISQSVEIFVEHEINHVDIESDLNPRGIQDTLSGGYVGGIGYFLGNKNAAYTIKNSDGQIANSVKGLRLTPSFSTPLGDDRKIRKAKVRAIGYYQNKLISSDGRDQSAYATIRIGYKIPKIPTPIFAIENFPAVHALDAAASVTFDKMLTLDIDTSGVTYEDMLNFLILPNVTMNESPTSLSDTLQKMELLISFYSFKLYLSIVVDLSKETVYGKNTGRLCPNSSYFNSASGSLMTNPSSVIEDFCRVSVPSMLYTDLDESAFDAFYIDRADWKLATAVFTGMK